MHPRLKCLQPYPFEKLSLCLRGLQPPASLDHIRLSIGEPQHATPTFIAETLHAHSAALANYPTTRGLMALRSTIAEWLCKRFQMPSASIDGETQVLPVNGTREALFSFAQAAIDPGANRLVLMPNPFYQIYEGAALLAGAEPYFLPLMKDNGYLPDYDAVPDDIWARCALLFICSPGNPTGALHDAAMHRKLLALAEQHDFIIAADECYSELYADESLPPQGLLQTAFDMGNTQFSRCVVFHSLSKRSNAPGLRSGFVAGDANLLSAYFNYRTYQGCAMSLPVQHASQAAWADERHVQENRELYRAKFNRVAEILQPVFPSLMVPPASFYLWLETPIDDVMFAAALFETQHVTVLPGQFLSRTFQGKDPGKQHVRVALVAPFSECEAAALRIRSFVETL